MMGIEIDKKSTADAGARVGVCVANFIRICRTPGKGISKELLTLT
jgi:hypothetical protein